MQKHIFSHTETDSKHPGYVALISEPKGTISVLLKRAGLGATPSMVLMDRSTLEEMGKAINDFLESSGKKKK